MIVTLTWDMKRPEAKKLNRVELEADTEEEKIALADFYLTLRIRGEATLKIEKETVWRSYK